MGLFFWLLIPRWSWQRRRVRAGCRWLQTKGGFLFSHPPFYGKGEEMDFGGAERVVVLMSASRHKSTRAGDLGQAGAAWAVQRAALRDGDGGQERAEHRGEKGRERNHPSRRASCCGCRQVAPGPRLLLLLRAALRRSELQD